MSHLQNLPVNAKNTSQMLRSQYLWQNVEVLQKPQCIDLELLLKILRKLVSNKFDVIYFSTNE